MNFYSRELVIIAVAGCAHFCNLFLLHTNNASVLFWWVFSLVRLNDQSLSHRFLHSSFFQMKACKWTEFIMFCIYSRSVVSICVSRLHSYPHCEADRSSPHSAESLTLTNMPFKKKHPTVASCYCFENRLKPTPCDHSRSVCSCTGGGWGGGLIILPVPRLYQVLDTEGEYVHFHPSHMGDSGSPITSDIINPASYSRNNHFYSPLCELKLSWPKLDSSANQNKAGPGCYSWQRCTVQTL